MLTALTRRTAHRHLPAFVGALAVLGGLAFQPAASAEEGNLMLTPTRVVLDDKQRTTVLSLVNRGKLPTTYRISVVMRRMNAAGELEIIETGSSVDQLAAQMVRFSPREVTLPPGVTQNVRLQIRKPADLAPGEYRTHVQCRRPRRAGSTWGR
jgi:P pilus assembly chaperone PapD